MIGREQRVWSVGVLCRLPACLMHKTRVPVPERIVRINALSPELIEHPLVSGQPTVRQSTRFRSYAYCRS
jgi:hypothetical protein